MGILQKLGLTRRGPNIAAPGQAIEERRMGASVPPLQSMYIPGMFYRAPNSTGVTVNEFTALAANAVYACVGVIASAVAGLPLELLNTQGGKVAQAGLQHPLQTLMDDEPNDYMTAPTFKECLMLNLLLWGNGYAFIDRDVYGNPISIYPLLSSATHPVRLDGNLWYQSILGTQNFMFRPDQIFHVLNFSYDGILGISPIRQQQQAVGLSIGLENFAAKFIGNGANLAGILKLPADMKDAAIKRFRDKWVEEHAGPENQFKTAVLPDGYSWTATSVDPEKAQVQEARVHQIREACRIFRVPPHKVADLERATFSNIEQQSLEFGQDTIAPWLTKLEKETKRKLLKESEKPFINPKFNMDAILRADMMTRYRSYALGVGGPWMTPDEARSKEGMQPIAGGDKLLQPMNMTPGGIDPNKDPAKE